MAGGLAGPWNQQFQLRPGAVTPGPIQRWPVRPASKAASCPIRMQWLTTGLTAWNRNNTPRVPHWSVTKTCLIRAWPERITKNPYLK